QPQAPAFTLPGMDQILADLVKKYPITQPTPMPPAPPQPKPEPKPEPKPAPKPEPKPEPKAPGGTVTVQKGDSLSKIAQRVLGDMNRWREIFELNRDKLSDPNKIYPGMVLKLPGGGNKPAPAPAPGPAPSGNAHDRRNNWYISQYGSKWNTN
ncbi:MAG: LysM peptidoglycan-binding domain-containing protein, partial [Tepidisphaerales bacterium]